MDQEISNRYEEGKKLIITAGNFAHSYFKKVEELKIEKKGIQDFVSQADKETETIIRKLISEKFPADKLVGEEQGAAKNHQQGFTWVIDPIDGTLPFLSNLNSWCVSIGLALDNKIVLGLVYEPVRGELYHAMLGRGAYLNDKKLSPKKSANLNEGLFGFGYSKPRLPIVIESLNQLLKEDAMIFRNGSGALMICYAASGRLIGYIEHHLNSWDACAAWLICKEAGLKVNSFDSLDWIVNGNPVLAAPANLYDKLQHLNDEVNLAAK